MKKVLIIGGDSSLCEGIISIMENEGYDIDMLTYFDNKKINKKYNWHHLDLMNEESVDSFINIPKDNYYDKIICAPTYNSGTNNPFITNRKYLSDVYGKFVINYMIIIRSLLKKITKDGHIIFISTISANVPTDMVDYSATKSAIQAYVSSISKKTKGGQAVYSIAPGMIYDTPSFYERDEEHSIEPAERLIKKEEIAKIILNADESYNGNVVIMDYSATYRMHGFKQINVEKKYDY